MFQERSVTKTNDKLLAKNNSELVVPWKVLSFTLRCFTQDFDNTIQTIAVPEKQEQIKNILNKNIFSNMCWVCQKVGVY